jgi:hypothetical protein
MVVSLPLTEAPGPAVPDPDALVDGPDPDPETGSLFSLPSRKVPENRAESGSLRDGNDLNTPTEEDPR